MNLSTSPLPLTSADRVRWLPAMSDPDHVPDWYANIHRVTWETEKPLTIGTRLAL